MKITKEMRADIITSVLAYKFKALEKEIEADRVALADALYKHAYGAVEKQARAMPKGWVSYYHRLTITCEGFSYHNGGTDLLCQLSMSKDQPFPAAEPNSPFHVNHKHQCWKQAWAIVQKHRKMLDARDELRQKMSSLLFSCNTLKQLETAWPEGKRFYPKEIKHSYGIVPVGLSDQINKVLGLPEKSDHATKAIREAAKQ